jgi:hypothetical protein
MDANICNALIVQSNSLWPQPEIFRFCLQSAVVQKLIWKRLRDLFFQLIKQKNSFDDAKKSSAQISCIVPVAIVLLTWNRWNLSVLDQLNVLFYAPTMGARNVSVYSAKLSIITDHVKRAAVLLHKTTDLLKNLPLRMAGSGVPSVRSLSNTLLDVIIWRAETVYMSFALSASQLGLECAQQVAHFGELIDLKLLETDECKKWKKSEEHQLWMQCSALKFCNELYEGFKHTTVVDTIGSKWTGATYVLIHARTVPSIWMCMATSAVVIVARLCAILAAFTVSHVRGGTRELYWNSRAKKKEV